MEPVDLVVPRQRALKHVQVREHVRGLIETQPPGSAAPSERELVARAATRLTAPPPAADSNRAEAAT